MQWIEEPTDPVLFGFVQTSQVFLFCFVFFLVDSLGRD